MRPRTLFTPFVLLFVVSGAVPVFADSVFVSNSSLRNIPGLGAFTGTFYCQQYGISSASCQTGSSSIAFPYVDSGGAASGAASFGKVDGGTVEGRSDGHVVASFSDDVVVNGGAGTGTLVSHYYLVSQGEATGGAPVDFIFVQGTSKTSITPTYQSFGGTPVANPPSGCETVGFCFSEAFDVAAPVAFGATVPLGAQLVLGTASGTLIPPNGDTTAYAHILLNGYTVLDASGNAIGDATVTRENLPPSFNLDFTPEPGTWALMVAGLGMLGAWRLRRNRPSV